MIFTLLFKKHFKNVFTSMVCSVRAFKLENEKAPCNPNLCKHFSGDG